MDSHKPKHLPRILDIDLDFFLDERSIDARDENTRLDPREYHPWSETRVRQFLDVGCGLRSEAPIRGACFEAHDELFWKWKRLIEQGELAVPFEVVHVDAHADLGIGYPSTQFVLHEHLHLPPDKRTNPPIGDRHLNEGSFLLFAIACRWITSLTYVYHPDCWNAGMHDVPFGIMKDDDDESGFIQLRCFPGDRSSRALGFRYCEPLAFEPTVRFERVPGEKLLESAPFDFVFLTQSPKYTPPTADAMIPILREYIDETS